VKQISLTCAILAVFLVLALTACSDTSFTHRTLHILTEEFPPFNYSENGQISGQSTEIVRAISEKTGEKPGFEILPWSQAYDQAQKEDLTALYSISRLAERETLFKWVGPIGNEDNCFYVRRDSNSSVKNLDEAKKAGSIAVYKNDSNQLYLSGLGFTNLDINSNDAECLKNLVDGKVEMWLGPVKALPYIARTAGVDPAALKSLFSVRNINWYIAFNKKTPDDMITAWQKALDDMKITDSTGSSEYDRILQRYNKMK
jgi:polar amino acid transport system substrate-binding protein